LAWNARGTAANLQANPSPRVRFQFALDSAFSALNANATAEARQYIQRGLSRVALDDIPPSERPWFALAVLAMESRDPALARRALAGFESDLAAASVDREGERAFFESHVALAEERWEEAIPLIREADRRFGIEERHAQAILGHAHDRAGRPDSAIAHYDKLLAVPPGLDGVEGYWTPRAHYRLGELYEARGDREKAIAHYTEFVSLWKDAEPALQPTVREARQRLERLVAEKG
jgi:tetratricopeptide (TPR) repeat protein